MAVNKEEYQSLAKELKKKNVVLVAVSKTKPVEDIMALYELGQRDFGENYVQELVDKAALLPDDIRWHFIGHLQTNKVKYIVPLVQLIQGVDSLKLLKEINKQAEKSGKVVDCLLQVYIASEETKFGLNRQELEEALGEATQLKHVAIRGLMGMASFTASEDQLRAEFRNLRSLFHPPLSILSMGMSADYALAIEEGSTMVRIGSRLFGQR